MQISEYNELFKTYNAAWNDLTDLRRRLREAESYLSAYGAVYRFGELRFRINPHSAIDPSHWPTVTDLLDAVAKLKTAGEQIVAGYNRLAKEQRYLVTLPELLD